MDAFKSTEIKRMQAGGNKAWQDFFNAHASRSADFADCTIKERYDSEAGEEYKERLSARCEDREFDLAKFKAERATMLAKQKEKEQSRSGAPMGANRNAIGSNTNSRTQSPAPGKGGMMDPVQKARNEEYFQRMGSANANRPDNLAPSQGGKYAGFGSSVPEPQQQQGGIPSTDEFTKDPIGALTKGFGWFSSTVAKQAKVVNESYIQPTAQNLAKTDFAAQAQKGLQTVTTGVASGAKGATEQFHKFVEGQDNAAASSAAARTGGRKVEPERKDFWDSFGASDDTPSSKPSTIGTAAMKKTTTSDAGAKKKKDDGWGDDW